MYATTYHRPASLDEAVELIGSGDGKFLAGGQTLIPAMRLRLAAPSDLIDLAHISQLKGIEVSGRTVTIRAGTTHAEVAENKDLQAVCPAICDLARHVGDPHVRHKGTIGGSIANNDPAADYPAAVLALGATVVTSKRELAAEDFFRGLFETALEEDEIITAVTFEAPERAGYEKFRNPASRFALTGVFVAKRSDGVRVAVTGAGDDGVFRATDLEAALAQNFDASALQGVTVSVDGLMTDIHASAEYRANLILVMARRAVEGPRLILPAGK
jgi:carbon-monoxide dehydrogenase medium subunit